MHILVWLRHCNRNHLKYSPLIPIIATIFIYSVNFYKHQIILKSILKMQKKKKYIDYHKHSRYLNIDGHKNL